MAHKWMLGALAGALISIPVVVHADEVKVAAADAPVPGPKQSQSQSSNQATEAGNKGGAAALPPLPADLPPAVRAYLEALQNRVNELEGKLNQGPKANPVTPPGSIPAVGGPSVVNPVPSARTLTGPLASRLQIGGYAEIRITNLGNSAGDRTGPHNNLDFQVARFRPRLTYFMDPHWEADVQINASTRSAAAASFTARDAYIEYHNGKNNLYALRLGQQKIPFGFETFVEGDEPRGPLERARYQEALVPDQRDIGLGAIYNPRHLPLQQAYFRGPLVALAVYNGNGINKQDNDESKNVAAQVRYPLGKNNTIGLSGFSGTVSTAPGATFTNQAGNFDWESYYGRFRTKAEVMFGRRLGHDINGGLGQIEYQTGVPGNFFVRYDWFDRDQSVGHDYWKRYSFGWYKDFTKNIRLTAEYDYVTNQLTQTRHPNTFGLELQANW